MATRLLRSSWWVDFGYGKTRYRQRSPVNTKAGAQVFEAVLRSRLIRGESLDSEEVRRAVMPTFDAFARRWLAEDVLVNSRLHTWRCRRVTLEKHLLPAFGKLALDRVTAERIDAFKMKKIAEGYNKATVRQFMKVLRRCLRVAWRKSILKAVPWFELPRAPMEKRDHLHADEVDRLLSDTGDYVWNAMIRTAIRTGMRVGELLALRWEDIDFQQGIVTVQRSYSRGVLEAPKTDQVRQIPLTADVLTALMSLARPSTYLFSKWPDAPQSRSCAANALDRIAARTNARPNRPFSWHVLRHTFATHALWNGADIRSVQSILGHASIEMTARYSHVSTASLREAVDRVARGLDATRVNTPSTSSTPSSSSLCTTQ